MHFLSHSYFNLTTSNNQTIVVNEGAHIIEPSFTGENRFDEDQFFIHVKEGRIAPIDDEADAWVAEMKQIHL